MTWDSLLTRLFVHGFEILLFGCFGFGILVQIAGAFCMTWFRLRRVSEVPAGQPAPGVSILKPCMTAVDREELNFRTFFEQEYPGPYEIIFVVSHETDSVVPLIRAMIAKYPKVDATLLISKTRDAFVRKVDSLHDAHRIAKYEVIVWSDSDVAVLPNYLSQMVGTLQEPDVSLVTTPQYDVGANNFATAFKTLSNNTDIGTFISTLNILLRNKKFAWGHSIAFRKADFDAFGDHAWDVINRFLADDQSLSYLFSQHGKQTVLRPIYCPAYYADKTWHQMLVQRRRWALCQRLAFQNLHIPMVIVLLSIPQISALVMMLTSGFSAWSVQVFVAVACIRIFNSFLFEALYTGTIRVTLRYFWTIVIADLMQLYFYAYAYGMDSVEFHGKRYRLVDKHFLEEVQGTEESQARYLVRLSRWAKSVVTFRN